MATIEKNKEGRLEPTQVRHKTLSAYYPNLITLHDYILTAPGPSISGVIQESDTDEYKHLVKETICAFRTSVGDRPPKGVASGSHQEVVDRVLVEVARRCTRDGKKDVLISSDKVSSQSAAGCKELRSVRRERPTCQHSFSGNGEHIRRLKRYPPNEAMADLTCQVCLLTLGR